MILLPNTTREEHAFTFDMDGYEQLKMVVPIGGILSTQDISAQLIPRKYPVTFHTNPAGTRILLDGKDVGTSNETGTLTLPEVEHGPHQITVSHDGFRTETKSIQINFSRQYVPVELVNEAELARQETESREREIAAHLDRGRALFRQSQYQQALDECETVLKLDPANAAAIALKNQIEQTRKILGQ